MWVWLSGCVLACRESPQVGELGQDSPSWESTTADGAVKAMPTKASSPPTASDAREQSAFAEPLATPTAKSPPQGVAPVDKDTPSSPADISSSGESGDSLLERRVDDLVRESRTSESESESDSRRQARVSPRGHRKAVPERVGGAASRPSAEGGEAVSKTSGAASADALVALLRKFVDELGFSDCVKIDAVSGSRSPLPSGEQRLGVQSRVPGFGLLRLERLPPKTNDGEQ